MELQGLSSTACVGTAAFMTHDDHGARMGQHIRPQKHVTDDN